MREITGFKVLTTPRSFGKGCRKPIEILEKAGIEIIDSPSSRPVSIDNLKQEIMGMDALIVGIDQVPAEVINAADKLKVISKYGVGVNNIDLESAKRRGIVVTYTPGANCRAVAELVLSFIFSLSRRIPYADKSTKSGRWEKISGIEVNGKTLGIVGMGKVGKILAMLALGIGMRVIVTDPYISQDNMKDIQKVEFLPLGELLSRSDFISLHIPLSEETRGFINKDNLSLVKKGAYFIPLPALFIIMRLFHHLPRRLPCPPVCVVQNLGNGF